MDTAEEFLNKGIRLYNKHQYEKAIIYCNKAIKLNKNCAEAYYIRGNAKYDLKQYNDALNDYDDAIRIKPQLAIAYYNRGNAKYDLGQKEKALTDYDKAIELKPSLAIAYYNRGNTQYDLSQKEKALEDYDKAIELNPELTDLVLSTKKKLEYDWTNPTTNRFVAYFDIMGFKDFVQKNRIEDVFEKLSKLIFISKNLPNYPNLENDSANDIEPNNNNIKTFSFSDSIIAFSKDDTQDSLKCIVEWSKSFMCKALKEFPIKGAIAHGKISIGRDQVFCGQPLIDAYCMQEELHYYGIVFHNSFDAFIEENNISNKDNFEEIETPLKSCGKVKHFNLNYFTGLTQENFYAIMRKFRATASGGVRKYIDNTERVYSVLGKKDTD